MQTLEPDRGAPESLVTRLREYLEPHDSECSLGWRGATEGDILEYIRLCELRPGKSLPICYLSYLRELGESNGDLFGDFKLVTELKRLMNFYHQCSELEPFSSDFPVCGMHQFADQISLDMRSEGDPPVMETSGGDCTGELSKSWEALVMQAAVIRVEARRLPLMRWFSRTPLTLQTIFGTEHTEGMRTCIREFSKPHGMQLSWVSDARHHILIGEACSLYTELDYAGGTFHRVFASSQSLLDVVQSQLEPKLGAGQSGRFVLHNGKITTPRA